MSLKAVASSNRQLKDCWKDGMQALQRKDRMLIQAKASAINGSINIDACLEDSCPNDNRWDYGLDINDHGVFVEVHPGHTSEVNTVLAKLKWLKTWFSKNCSGFNGLSKSYYWVATGSVAIRRGSPQARRLSSEGITGPWKYLNLSYRRTF